MKMCNKCGEVKEYCWFYRHMSSKDGWDYVCKKCKLARVLALRLRNPGIRRYRKIVDRSQERKWPAPSQESFLNWFSATEKKCAYCDLTDLNLEYESKWIKYGFTIDRKDHKRPYDIDNICFACWTCNRLKSDFFTAEQFREVAQKYIKPRWLSQ